MNIKTHTHLKLSKTLIVIFCSLLFLQNSFAQIDIKKGNVATTFDYFDPVFLAKNKIKSISISFSSKKSMQPIIKNEVKKEQYDFNVFGKLTRYYSISNYGKVENIEWRKYKDNLLYKRYKNESGKIAEYTYRYFEGKESIRTYGVANNVSGNDLELQTANYKEIDNRYYSYVSNPEKGKKTKETKSFNKVIFLRDHTYFKDSLLIKEETKFRYFRHKNEYATYQYDENKMLIEKGFYPKKSQDNAVFKYTYYHDKRVKSIQKFNSLSNKLIENQEFVYSDKTGFLQAIISQNKTTREMKISKFNYTFF